MLASEARQKIRESNLTDEEKLELETKLNRLVPPVEVVKLLEKGSPKKSPVKKPKTKKVRARDEKGRLVGDDPSTPDVNEAWVAAKPFAPKDNKKQVIPEAK